MLDCTHKTSVERTLYVIIREVLWRKFIVHRRWRPTWARKRDGTGLPEYQGTVSGQLVECKPLVVACLQESHRLLGVGGWLIEYGRSLTGLGRVNQLRAPSERRVPVVVYLSSAGY
jgi:hypothetical protein